MRAATGVEQNNHVLPVQNGASADQCAVSLSCVVLSGTLSGGALLRTISPLRRSFAELVLQQLRDLVFRRGASAVHVTAACKRYARSLQQIDVSRCVSFHVSALALCASLQTLDASRCGWLTDVSALAGCASLQTLDLSGCDGLTDVSALVRLHAAGVKITT